MSQTVQLPDNQTAEFPDDMPPEKIAEVVRKQFPPKAEAAEPPKQTLGQIAKTAGEAALETGKEFIQGLVPKSDLATLAEILVPPALGPIEAYKQAQGVVSTVEQVQSASKTPDWSKERFKAGYNVVGQMGMLALGSRGLRPKLAEQLAPILKELKPESPTPATDVALERTLTDTTQEREIQRAGDVTSRTPEEAGVSGGVRPATESQAQETLTQPTTETPAAAGESATPAAATPPIPQIPEDATANVKFKTSEGSEVTTEMNAREAEGIFTKERSSYQALLDCLGA